MNHSRLWNLSGIAASFTLGIGLCGAPLFSHTASADGTANDLALVLAVDVSASIDEHRYRMQIEGIASALEDPIIQDSLLGGPTGESYLTLVQWSNSAVVSVPWTRITSAEDANNFAKQMRSLRQNGAEKTCLARSLRQIVDRVLATKPGMPARVVIDVSGDGRDNCDSSAHVDLVMRELKASNVQVNGLPILEDGEKTNIVNWYQDHVVAGPKGFIVPSKGTADIARAMKVKLLAEISTFDGDDYFLRRTQVATLNERPQPTERCSDDVRLRAGIANTCIID